MRNLLIIAEARGYLLISMETAFKNASYRFFTLPADTNAIKNLPESIDGILLYVEEKLLEHLQTLTFLRDRTIADGIPIFVLGNMHNLELLKDIIPEHIIKLKFVRPLNVHINILVKQISECIDQNKGRRTILIVDDSGAWLRNAKGWLEEKYSVSLANSGAMTIKYLTLNRPDLILLDYDMPIVDGKQVLEMIRAEAEFTTIPVMFLTNMGDTSSIMKVRDLRPEGYLLKTMTPQLIVKTVDDFFELRKRTETGF